MSRTFLKKCKKDEPSRLAGLTLSQKEIWDRDRRNTEERFFKGMKGKERKKIFYPTRVDPETGHARAKTQREGKEVIRLDLSNKALNVLLEEVFFILNYMNWSSTAIS